MKNKILVIAPHPDDEVIGCGGTILKHINDNDRVFIFYVTNGEIDIENDNYFDECKQRFSEALKSSKMSHSEILFCPEVPARKIRDNYTLILNRLERVFRKLKPNIVYLPHKRETDFDHKLTYDITKEAYVSSLNYKNNSINNVKTKLFGYEVWTPIQKLHKLNNIESYAEKKKKLINIYESQTQKILYSDGILGLNKYRGCYFGNCQYAEAFSIITI